ncbi:hypothetical protein PIB30_040966 [Stylosanthes scabra]|uniref:Uncharacterized protein n=1 Tax=Stylosanthes scabra TaxID=79078 RepID=A0ABU6TEF9_9FABA|nr:hypothetical protein [Stylosanthes scabra]
MGLGWVVAEMGECEERTRSVWRNDPSRHPTILVTAAHRRPPTLASNSSSQASIRHLLVPCRCSSISAGKSSRVGVRREAVTVSISLVRLESMPKFNFWYFEVELEESNEKVLKLMMLETPLLKLKKKLDLFKLT